MRSRHRIRPQTPYLPEWRTDPLEIGPRSCPPATDPSPGRGSRYELLAKLASGGAATVYLGRLRGAAGFWRLCAIKRPHPHLTEEPGALQEILEEARLASMLHHPNVVAIVDVEQQGGQLALVMDYIEGASLAHLLTASTAAKAPLPPRVGVRVALDACAGLGAAHGLTDVTGEPLGLVHRDVSPQNVLVGVDGTTRIADFGIARHARSCSRTAAGVLKGKICYMAPEYVEGGAASARGDVFALGVVAWEALANRRLFRGESEADTLRRVAVEPAPLLSSVAPWVGKHLDRALAAALSKSPDARPASAGALGEALEAAARPADLVGSHAEVGAHVRVLAREALAAQRRVIEDRIRADAPLPPRRRDGGLREGAHAGAGLAPPPVSGGSREAPTVRVAIPRPDDAGPRA